MNATQELDMIYATIDPNEPDSNVELANRFVCEMEREAKQAASEYEGSIDWMTREGMVTELAYMRDLADEAEKQLAAAYDLRVLVIDGCTCQSIFGDCAYCKAVNVMREYLDGVE